MVVRGFFGSRLKEKKVLGKSIVEALGYIIESTFGQMISARFRLFGIRILKMGLFKKDREVTKHINEFRKVIRQEVKTKLESPSSAEKETKDLLDYLREGGYISNQGSTHQVSVEEIVDEFITFYGAGMDTTGHLAGMILYYLGKYKEVMDKVVFEVDTHIKSDIDFTDENIKKLEYLDCVINETLRHYGPVNSIFPRICIKENTLGGIKIKKGTLITMRNMGPKYCSKYFPDPWVYKPERWMDRENMPHMKEPYSFTPFSAG